MNELKRLIDEENFLFTSPKKIQEKLKGLDIKLSLNKIKEFLKSQEYYQVSKPTKKKYISFFSHQPFEQIQMDLLDVSNMSTTNGGINFLLFCVDVFSRYAFIYPLKSKNMNDVSDAFLKMLKVIDDEGFNVHRINCDNGSEFVNQKMKEILKNRKIEMILNEPNQYNKLAIVNRLMRTIRSLMNNFMNKKKTNRYIDVLDELVDNYNNSYHKTLRMTPTQAVNNVDKVYDDAKERYIKSISQVQNFYVGDKVRYKLKLDTFEKGTSNKWTTRIYTIEKVNGNSYILNNGKSYMSYELQKIGNVNSSTSESTIRARERAKEKAKGKRRFEREGLTTEKIVPTKKKTRKQQPNRSYDLNLKHVSRR